MNVLTVLIKPSSSACNLACEYCFYHSLAKSRNEHFKGMMSLETAENIIISAFKTASRVFFAFQGGEPTLSGLDFFRGFTNLVNKHRGSKAAMYSIQTNAVSVNEEWCRFFVKNDFLVGVSLDGEHMLHDRLRKDKAGRGSYDRVMSAIKLMQTHNVKFNILTVVTNLTVKRTEQIFKFFMEKEFKFLQFIPCLDDFGVSPEDGYRLDDRKYGEFLIRLFDLWIKELKKDNYISIRHIDNLIMQISGKAPELCGADGRCNIQFVIESDGGVYPCDFYVMDGHCMGNINERDFFELNQTTAAQSFLERGAHPIECAKCSFSKICNSGCKRYHENVLSAGDISFVKNKFCGAFKAFYAYAVPILSDLVKYLNNRKRGGL